MKPDGDDARSTIGTDIGEACGYGGVEKLFCDRMLKQIETPLLNGHDALLVRLFIVTN
jgi:hypothetical protein